MAEEMDKGTKFVIGAAVGGAGLSFAILYNYPQKYWIPWFFILAGSMGTTIMVGAYMFSD